MMDLGTPDMNLAPSAINDKPYEIGNLPGRQKYVNSWPKASQKSPKRPSFYMLRKGSRKLVSGVQEAAVA